MPTTYTFEKAPLLGSGNNSDWYVLPTEKKPLDVYAERAI